MDGPEAPTLVEVMLLADPVIVSYYWARRYIYTRTLHTAPAEVSGWPLSQRLRSVSGSPGSKDRQEGRAEQTREDLGKQRWRSS